MSSCRQLSAFAVTIGQLSFTRFGSPGIHSRIGSRDAAFDPSFAYDLGGPTFGASKDARERACGGEAGKATEKPDRFYLWPRCRQVNDYMVRDLRRPRSEGPTKNIKFAISANLTFLRSHR